MPAKHLHTTLTIIAFSAAYMVTASIAVTQFHAAIDARLVVVAVCGVWISVVDTDSLIVPDIATIAIAAAGLLLSSQSTSFLVVNLALSLVLMACLWVGSEIFYRVRGIEGLGLGDVKLIAAIAVFAGVDATPWIILVASTGGIAFAVARLLLQSGGGRSIPFAPFLTYALLLSELMGF